ncbi:hypothetical protein F4679DRAFT_84211 [Xylaria curta]|nr:hypothetical protein F4679DRAFT_84211 [Xylaria curta]
MVDHLWLSIASDKTVVTSCSEESNGESTTIQDAIRNRCNLDRGKGPRVSFALGMIPLAIAVCCKQTIDLKLETGTGKENILQVFRSEIAKVVNREVELFDRFKACVDEASHLLLNDQMSRNGSLSEEIELLKEVKDILDELNIIYTVTSQQEYILDTAFDSLDGFDDQSEIAALLDYYRTFSNIYHIRKEVNKLIYDAKQIQKNINHLLDLRQKDANLSEAIWARNSAENTARQGRTILVFTVVTIIFLPITFLSSLFALNITSFPHDKDGSLSYSPQWAYSRLCKPMSLIYNPKKTT